MTALLVVDSPSQWPLTLPGAKVVAARDYLTNPRYSRLERGKVFNLCRSMAYQTVGYYVSLLAAARGHRPLPSVTTARDLRESPLVRIADQEMQQLMQRALSPLSTDRFTLSIYFGRNLARRYDRLCQIIFDHFPAPLLRAEFVRGERWRLSSLRLLGGGDIPDAHHEFVLEQARRYFARPRTTRPRSARYDLAILVDPTQTDCPSDEKAIARFVRAGQKLGVAVTVIQRQDYGRLAEYDALFIRETTSVNHHTYRFASRARAEGLVVIDDPDSIVRCTNKVYQAELFEKHGIACPKTMVVHRDNMGEVAARLGLPCVLKQPDSAFSAGVVRARDEAELKDHLIRLLAQSELVVAQGFVTSTFDWRIGVLDGQPLFACKYYMARGHWQIQKATGATSRSYGKVDTLPLDQAPPQAVDLGVRAASLIGRGLYGVDIKESNGDFLVMEVNDNPNIDAGNEDAVLGDELYRRIIQSFVDRLEEQRRAQSLPPPAPEATSP